MLCRCQKINWVNIKYLLGVTEGYWLQQTESIHPKTVKSCGLCKCCEDVVIAEYVLCLQDHVCVCVVQICSHVRLLLCCSQLLCAQSTVVPLEGFSTHGYCVCIYHGLHHFLCAEALRLSMKRSYSYGFWWPLGNFTNQTKYEVSTEYGTSVFSLPVCVRVCACLPPASGTESGKVKYFITMVYYYIYLSLFHP